MDATLGQIPDLPLQRVIGPADELSHEEPATFRTDQAWVGYLLVDDIIDLKPEHRKLMMGSEAELARKGVQFDFSREAFAHGTELFNRVVDRPAAGFHDGESSRAVVSRPSNGRDSGWPHRMH